MFHGTEQREEITPGKKTPTLWDERDKDLSVCI